MNDGLDEHQVSDGALRGHRPARDFHVALQ